MNENLLLEREVYSVFLEGCAREGSLYAILLPHRRAGWTDIPENWVLQIGARLELLCILYILTSPP